MVYSKKYWINRFPICALVYKEAAEMLGYDEDEAKSLGHARAIFFAAAKRGFGAGVAKKGIMNRYHRAHVELEKAGADPNSYDMINFAGLETYAVLVDGDVRAFFGGKVIRPEDYDNAIGNKLLTAGGEKGYERARAYIYDKLSELSEAELNSGAVFKVYEKLRDYVREMAFLEEKYVGTSA